MVLPDTWSSALLLLILAAICFVFWPNLLKIAGSKWRFELFSIDFALGSLLVALLAAYTLGSRGSELDFSDSMLVAGRRAEVMAVGAGAVFALGNMLYFATISLLGLSNGTLLTFSVFGCAVALLRFSRSSLLYSIASILILAIAAICAVAAARAARPSVKPTSSRSGNSGGRVALGTISGKGTITGLLAGMALAAVWPVLSLAQTDQFGIGAYGGMLMGAIGIVVATFLFNFFFMNISLEGGSIGYSNYFTGSWQSHATGAASGVLWTAGALALYTAKTGGAGVSNFGAYLVPFLSALIATLTGVIFWQKMQLPATAMKMKWLSVIFFAAGATVLLSAIHS